MKGAILKDTFGIKMPVNDTIVILLHVIENTYMIYTSM